MSTEFYGYREPKREPRPSELALNDKTPCGLFETQEGNKYLVTDHAMFGGEGMYRVAISLVHTTLPPWTWFALDEHASAIGHWHGPYRFRLLSVLEEECAMGFPGVITTGDCHASIQCRDLDGGVEMLSLGYVGRNGFKFRDIDGWSIECQKFTRPFFEKPPAGNVNFVIQPKWPGEGHAGLNNILKQMVKEGRLEKSLARPNSKMYSYRGL